MYVNTDTDSDSLSLHTHFTYPINKQTSELHKIFRKSTRFSGNRSPKVHFRHIRIHFCSFLDFTAVWSFGAKCNSCFSLSSRKWNSGLVTSNTAKFLFAPPPPSLLKEEFLFAASPLGAGFWFWFIFNKNKINISLHIWKLPPATGGWGVGGIPE